jgi:hypothetical protein
MLKSKCNAKMRVCSISPVLLAFASPGLRADDFETLHIFNTNFNFKPGWTLQMHTRFRTFENANTFNQFRGGPIMLWQANKRLTVMSGYYFTDQNTRVIHRDYILHRMWGGGQFRVATGRNWALDARSLLERFASKNFADYWRQRNRATVNLKAGKLQPFCFGEALVVPAGWYGRYGVGANWPLTKKLLVGAAYEYRDAPRGQSSHVLATSFQFVAHDYVRQPVD